MSQEEKMVNVSTERLHELIKGKLTAAGLKEEHANEVANHLVFADLSGVHSHGAVRVEYYSERIAKGGVTTDPQLNFEKTGDSTGIFHGDNGVGQYVANESLNYVRDMAKESGVAVVGLSKVSHTGTLSYYAEKIAKEDLVCITMCQSDPMAVPFGGSEVYYGTNPIAFSAPRADGRPVVFDMATTVQAWGKILDARSKNNSIPEGWAVDENGNSTTDAHKVSGLMPISGPKGYGLMMMIDMLSGMLLGLPFGNRVSSMYADLTKGRDLGHLFIVIDPSRFTDLEEFKGNVEQTVKDLHGIQPAEGYDQVYYPGEIAVLNYEENSKNGIEIPESIISYLESDDIHYDNYGNQGTFA